MSTPTVSFADPKEVKAHLINTTKKLQIALDQIINSTQDINKNVIKGSTGGREYSLTITKLEEAKMWLEKALKEFGLELPEA